MLRVKKTRQLFHHGNIKNSCIRKIANIKNDVQLTYVATLLCEIKDSKICPIAAIIA